MPFDVCTHIIGETIILYSPAAFVICLRADDYDNNNNIILLLFEKRCGRNRKPFNALHPWNLVIFSGMYIKVDAIRQWPRWIVLQAANQTDRTTIYLISHETLLKIRIGICIWLIFIIRRQNCYVVASPGPIIFDDHCSNPLNNWKIISLRILL